MNRRNLLVLLGGTAIAWPLAVSAQQARVPTIGILLFETSGSEDFRRQFEMSLRELGYIDGQTVRFEFRSDHRTSRLSELAAELVRLNVDIIVAWLTPAAQAAKQATRDIPIVMLAGNPVETGLVESLARPGGNVTGTAAVGAELSRKCVELIRDLLPSVHRVAALVNTPDPFSKFFIENIRLGGKANGITIDPFMLHGPEELEPTFALMEKDRADAVIVQPTLGLKRSAELALTTRIPAVSIIREFAEDGGLMSYSGVGAELYRRTAAFVDKILKGAKPADIPVEQPTKFELVINLKTAKALGLTIPERMVDRADEVIE